MKNLWLSVLIFGAERLPAQVISSSKWSDLFAYNDVLTIREDHGKLIAATENGLFYYNPDSGEVTKLSKANGLHEVNISAFDYNAETRTGLIGYENGSMDLITPDGITYVVDIPIAKSYTGTKRINHISITGDLASVSANYGVSVFNLKNKGFGDTAFFNTGSTYEAVKESVILNNTLYALTASGIRMHQVNGVTFPIYSTWSTFRSGEFKNIDTENGVLAYASATAAWYGDGTAFTQLPESFSDIRDITIAGKTVLVTEPFSVSAFSSGSLTGKLSSEAELNTAWFAQEIFGGSVDSGILNGKKQSIMPDGPYDNRAYKIHLNKNKLLVSSGLRSNRYNQANPDTRNLGFYFYDGTQWVYPSFFRQNNKSSRVTFNVLDAISNPADYKDVYFANYTNTAGQGFYRMKYDNARKDFDLVKIYTTGAPDIANRPAGLVYDDNNNLYSSVAYFSRDNAATVSTAYGVFQKTADDFAYRSSTVVASAQKPLYYEGMLWIPAPRTTDLLAVDLDGTPSNLNDDKLYYVNADSGLPSNTTNSVGVISLAFDNFGDAWIGTDKGLRVLADAAVAVKNNPTAEPIIITQHGTGEELFRDAEILQIEVDTGNRKWVSTNGGGVFYITPNGQQTLLHFTKENSPLPDNAVTDVKVDSNTGKVYFVTANGIVVYNGDVASVSNNFKDVLVYPNPVVSAHYQGNVHIRGLAEKTNIRITDAAGNLVHQAVAMGGTYEWDLTNKGRRVASGVYFVLMTNADATDKATAKIAVVN